MPKHSVSIGRPDPDDEGITFLRKYSKYITVTLETSTTQYFAVTVTVHEWKQIHPLRLRGVDFFYCSY